MSKSKVGKVVARQPKTAIVEVQRIKVHPIYKKRYKVSKRYKVETLDENVKIGEIVNFSQSRPTSHDKRWKLNRSKKGNKTK